jgi:hypothetical protein
MGDEAGSKQAAGVMAGKAALWTRPSIWKSAIVIAPLAATALFLASGTHAQTSGSTVPSSQPTDATTVAPKPAPVAARRGRGPKEKTKILVGRTASPTTEPTASNPVAPIDAPDAAEKKAKVKSNLHLAERNASGTEPATPAQTGTPVAPIDAPDAARRKGPKGDSGSDAQGRTAVPAPDSTPAEGRREGPKGAVGHGRTEAPAPDTQPTGRRKEGPKGDVGHGRTSKTPLIIGALSAAAVLALVVSSGNDRPASP